MTKSFLSIICFTFACFSFAQTKEQANSSFTIKWENDSLGKNGFRQSHCRFDKESKSCNINGKNIKGYTKGKIISLLGSPNTSKISKKDNHTLIISYIILNSTIAGKKSLVIFFDANNLVDQAFEGNSFKI